MSTEYELLRTFRDRLAHLEHSRLPLAELQDAIKTNGADIVRALQNNHGHTLAAAVGLLREVLTLLDIKPAQGE
jgi:membrane-bound lytic murein transglycosylase MltF